MNKNRSEFYKTRSRSVNEKHMKSYTAAQSNKKNNSDNRDDKIDKYFNHMENMEKRVKYVKGLKLKCGQDIYTHSELKDETFGELQKRNWKTLKRSQEMSNQVCFLKLRDLEQKMKEREEFLKKAAETKVVQE